MRVGFTRRKTYQHARSDLKTVPFHILGPEKTAEKKKKIVPRQAEKMRKKAQQWENVTRVKKRNFQPPDGTQCRCK